MGDCFPARLACERLFASTLAIASFWKPGKRVAHPLSPPWLALQLTSGDDALRKKVNENDRDSLSATEPFADGFPPELLTALVLVELLYPPRCVER